jgi:DNA-3-methyladenine glycosylase
MAKRPRNNQLKRPLGSSDAVPEEFFRRPAAEVARELIGMTLAREAHGTTQRNTITETEAYEGVHDLASHSSKGRTKRNEVMFGAAGRFYVYRVYGLHWMLNIVTGEVDEGAGVLIRGIEGISGPGRVAAALHVDGSLQGRPAGKSSGLWFEAGALGAVSVKRTARIGVEYAGPIWAEKKLRFVPKV